MLIVAVMLGLAAALRGFGPYYLNPSPPVCAGKAVVICTNHRTYRTLEHVQVTVANYSAEPIVVERDHHTGSIELTGEGQVQGDWGNWWAGGLDLRCEQQCGDGHGCNCPSLESTPDTTPRDDTVAIPPGGLMLGDYFLSFPWASGRFRLVLVYAPTAEVLHTADDEVAASRYKVPEDVSLPASAVVVESVPIDMIDNGDRFPAPQPRA